MTTKLSPSTLFNPCYSCPLCGTLKSIVPSLVLLYSSCCGFVACNDCLETKLFPPSSKVSSIPCPGKCGEQVTVKSFVPTPLGEQRYLKQQSVRQRCSRVLNLTRADTATEEEWNDYLEFESDILYDMVYGNKQEREAAEKRLNDYYTKNREAIERRNRLRDKQANNAAMQKVVDLTEDAASTAAAAATASSSSSSSSLPSYTLPAVSGAPSMSFVLPQPASLPPIDASCLKTNPFSLYPSKDEDAALFSMPEGEEKRRLLRERTKILYLSRQAGGADQQLFDQREMYEAMQALVL